MILLLVKIFIIVHEFKIYIQSCIYHVNQYAGCIGQIKEQIKQQHFFFPFFFFFFFLNRDLRCRYIYTVNPLYFASIIFSVFMPQVN